MGAGIKRNFPKGMSKSEYDRAWRQANKEKLTEYHRQQARKVKQENPAKKLWSNARTRAREKGIPFTIEISDIVVPTHCPVYGFELGFDFDKRHHRTPSLDRIKPELGYVPGNIQVMSWRANNLKRDATWQELHTLAEYLRRQEIELAP